MEIEVVRRVLEKNENAANENRTRFDALGITCVNLLGGAGCGKTTLLEKVIPILTESLRVGVLEGDLATTKDAERIAKLNVPVVQLLTDGGCHLTASLVKRGLDRLDLDSLDLVIIENVGNPICPANFELGEHVRISVLSVTEGDDKPLKYPLLFRQSRLTVITKCDLWRFTDFNLKKAMDELRRVNPDTEIIETDLNSRFGLSHLANWISQRCQRAGRAVGQPAKMQTKISTTRGIDVHLEVGQSGEKATNLPRVTVASKAK